MVPSRHPARRLIRAKTVSARRVIRAKTVFSWATGTLGHPWPADVALAETRVFRPAASLPD